MGIPNVKRFRITSPEGEVATVMAVLPKGADVDAYLKDAASRFDWKAWREMKSSHTKIRVGQQKQRKAK
jgi:proline dehydrogenase